MSLTAEKVVHLQPNPVTVRPVGIGGSSMASQINVNVGKPSLSTDNSSMARAVSQVAASTANQKSVIEYSLRVPKTNVKPISMMRFNGALNVDITKWSNVKMQRDDGGVRAQKVNIAEDEQPKFGAGSEYGREAREEARRRKYTPVKKKINVEDQPWVLKTNDKDKVTRKFRGVRDGGLTQHASYFIFTQAADGVFEVFPVQSWFNFTTIQKYKCLTAEEAEEEFGRRNKIMNYFSLMVSKRLQLDEAGEGDGEKGNGKSGSRNSASSTLKVSEMEDWDDSDDKDDDSDAEGDAEDKRKKKGPVKNKKKKTSDDEGMEDSDDGDGEGRELDYISDSTDSETEEEAQKKAAQLGVDQESGLKRLLDSDDSSGDEEANDEKEEEKDDEPGPTNKDEKGNAEQKDKKKKKKRSKKNKKDGTENLSDDDEEDEKDEKPVDDVDSFIDPADSDSSGSGNNSGDNSPDGPADNDHSTGVKRKASADIFSGLSTSSKKAKIEMSSSMLQSAASEGITEDSVRRYLARKPMTATELLQKFKSKKTKISSQDMVNVIAHLLKKINPVKRMQHQKMYLFLSSK